MTPVADGRLRSEECAYLGDYVVGQDGKVEKRKCPPCEGNVRIKIRRCELHGECTTHSGLPGVRCCGQGGTGRGACGDYHARPANPPPTIFEAAPGDPACGVVVGTYGPDAAAIAELQIRMVHYTCGDVPILVADDASECRGQLNALVPRYPSVAFWPNSERIGHRGGDLAVFWKGVQWAQQNNLQYIAKLSQRFIPLRKRWLQDGATALHASGFSVLGQDCKGGETHPIRSEAVVLRVGDWSVPEVTDQLTPQLLSHPTKGGLERYLAGIINRLKSGAVLTWDLLPPDRYIPRPQDFIWHCTDHPQVYQMHAQRMGIVDFPLINTDGWQNRPDYLPG
jgi:hypothetical protein